MLTFAEWKPNCSGVRKGVFCPGDISHTLSLGDGKAEEKDYIPGPYLWDLFSKANYHSVSNDIRLMSQRRYKER